MAITAQLPIDSKHLSKLNIAQPRPKFLKDLERYGNVADRLQRQAGVSSEMPFSCKLNLKSFCQGSKGIGLV
jgi:hypothetical protein